MSDALVRQVLISGELEKLSNHGFSWNTRYVEFDGTNLRYFNGKSLPVKGVMKVSKASIHSSVNHKSHIMFIVKDDLNHTYVFGCKNSNEREEWLDILNAKGKKSETLYNVMARENRLNSIVSGPKPSVNAQNIQNEQPPVLARKHTNIGDANMTVTSSSFKRATSNSN